MNDYHFKDRYSYIERKNNERVLNDVQKRRLEQPKTLNSVELKGNNMRLSNMQKDTYTLENKFNNLNRKF